MNKHLKNYFHSFKFKKTYWKTVLYDGSFFILLALVFSWFGSYIQRKSIEITGNKTPEQLQQMLASSPELLATYLIQLKSFLITIIVLFLVLAIIFLLFYSLTRAQIWNFLLKRKLSKKTYWKWNTLNLALIFPLLILGFGYLILRIIFGVLLNLLLTIKPDFYFAHSTGMEIVRTLSNGIISLFLGLFVLIFVLITYYSFTQKYKVWVSIGESFELIKKRWSRIWRLLILASLTAIIITLITYPLKTFFLYQPLILTLIQLIVSILFIAWLRLYLIRTIDEH
ncbi:MAG: hypothetical protein KJ771_05340 [Nanoarchaeota archaeon]|nr:hypothetical protein [Nanoarchaeota archaeon]